MGQTYKKFEYWSIRVLEYQGDQVPGIIRLQKAAAS